MLTLNVNGFRNFRDEMNPSPSRKIGIQFGNLWILVFSIVIGFFSHSGFSLEQSPDTSLIPFAWGQVWPYNKYCPLEPLAAKEYNGHTPVGCIAVTMSQVMRYYKYPATGTGIVSYLTEYGNISRDFSKSNYNWQQMPQFLNPDSDSTAIAQTAQLMFDCAVSVQMNFSRDLSGASITDLLCALENYFAYNPNMWGYNRSSLPAAKWDSIICNEINLRRPVIYSTTDSISKIGHSIIIDGYKHGQDLKYRYHCNWGWGGLFNGYYPLDSLYASGGRYGNDSDFIIIRISPPTLPAPKNLRYKFTTDKIETFAQADTFVLLEWDPITDADISGYRVVYWTDRNRKDKYFDRPLISPLSTEYHPNIMAISFNDTLIYAVQSVDRDSIASLYSNTIMITADDIKKQLPAKWQKKQHDPAPFSMHYVSSKNHIEFNVLPVQRSSSNHLKLAVFNCRGAIINNLYNSSIAPGHYLFSIPQGLSTNGFFIIKASLDNKTFVLRVAKIK
jgi:hypothetical protein